MNSLDSQLFTVSGTVSGNHSGKVVLADDEKTVIFKPNLPFTLGETVQVDIRPGMSAASSKKYAEISYTFSISRTDPSSPKIVSALNNLIASEIAPSVGPSAKNTAPSQYLTTPSDFPHISVLTPAGDVADGDIFASNFVPNAFLGDPDPGSYLLILDNNGEPVYYQKVPETKFVTDFKELSNGFLAYWEGGKYYLLDNHYAIAKEITAENGFSSIDVHDLLFLPNGHYMFLIYYGQTVDMSQVVPGGNPNATVVGSIIQEIDTDGNVVFQWNSFDHIPITDTNQDMTAATVDYMHSNAIEQDNDGNILLSNRHLDEVTKINHQTGDIIWRLGGKENQFAISAASGINDVPEFYMQHDIRRLPNGDITLFDNHNNHSPMNSRALEYSLDEVNKTATLVWEFRNTPDVFNGFMGNVQHLSNGNIMIGWGGVSSPNITEIKPDGTKVLELGFDTPYVNYRSFRFQWHGYPTWAPALVIQPEGGSIKLTFSWNGATDIAKYDIYGGNTLQNTTLIEEVSKTGFETSADLVGSQTNYCYFQVLPINTQGQATQNSNIIWNPACATYIPIISSSGQ